MDKTRLNFLDIAKGLGIILVLYSHSCGFPVFGNAVVAFYMPLFFFVSGYVYKGGRTPKENIKRKLKQLLIPYAGYTLLLYAENVILRCIKHELNKQTLLMPLLGALYSRGALYADMSGENVYFFLISNGPMWFITAMAVASIIFYLFVDSFLSDKKSAIAISAVLIGITIAFSYCPLLLPWSIDTAFACALFMLAGAKLGSISYFSDANKSRFRLWQIIASAAVYCVLTQYAEPINLSIRDYGYSGITGALWFLSAAFAGVIIFLWICRYIEKYKWTRVIIAVGRHTYSIMALHIFLIKYLNKAYFIFHMTFQFDRGCIWYWVYWNVLFVLVIIICMLFDLIIGKIRRKFIWN